MNLKKLIKEHLLLEKRIAQLVDSFEVTFSLDIIKHSGHAEERSMGIGREKIDDYDMRPVTNQEINYFVDLFKRDIAEKLVTQEIKSGESFVIKSFDKGLAIPLKAFHVVGTNWKLIVLSVWRETKSNPFRTSRNQVVIYK